VEGVGGHTGADISPLYLKHLFFPPFFRLASNLESAAHVLRGAASDVSFVRLSRTSVSFTACVTPE